MIIPDVNVLIYATFSHMGQHLRAKKWWVDALRNEEVGIPLVVIFGFIRISTNRKIFVPPLGVEQATSLVVGWLEAKNVRVVTPGPRHLEIAFQMLRKAGAGGNLTTDAQIAALAIEHQAMLCSNDSDFLRFPGLRWIDPLESKLGKKPALE